ncbi:baseplate hub subunit and tail lysozyme [Yersinia phage fHe-Yen9-02]|nr:baseplate hub subunit and tail lysozyme [Yersinia phage fHe-Yen9-02]
MMPLNGHVSKKGIDAQMSYDAIVTDNNDPQRIMQVRARIAGIMDDIPDEQLPWLRPTIEHLEGYKGGNEVTRFGTQYIPQRNAKISVKFPSGDIYSGEYSTNVRMTQADQLPEFQTNYPHRIGYHLSSGKQDIHDRSTNETIVIYPGDRHVVIMGDAFQTILGNQTIAVTDTKNDVPDYIRNDPNYMVKSLKPDPKNRAKFPGLLGAKAGSQHTSVRGNQTTEVYGDRKVVVHGKDILDVKGSIDTTAGGEYTVNGQTINLN